MLSRRPSDKKCHSITHNIKPFLGNGSNTHSLSICKVLKWQVEPEFNQNKNKFVLKVPPCTRGGDSSVQPVWSGRA